MKYITLLTLSVFISLAIDAQVQPTREAPAQQNNEQPVQPQAKDGKEIFEYVEQMPEFPGGEGALMGYLGKQMRYPRQARELNLEGKVFVSFVIDTEGNVTDVKELRTSVNDVPNAKEEELKAGRQALTDEAIRVCKSMPKWMPGKQNGRAVNCKFNLPIKFVLK